MKIGIIGSGAMGTGIAQVAAAAGADVLVYDNNPQAVDRATGRLRAIYDRLIEKGHTDRAGADEVLGHINYAGSMLDLADRELVVEAIVEDLGVKKTVFEQLDRLVGPDTVLATNTSSLSVTSIAAACQHPERVIGLHFFNPAPLMALVEVVPALQTAADLPARMTDLMRSWGKTPVVVKDTPGFIVNRLARPFYGEALRIYEEGVADPATIDWAMTELGGFRMGPFALMDYIGHDVNYAVTSSVFEAFYYDPRYRPAFSQLRLVEAGYLGRKAGRGFYRYSEAGKPMNLPAPNEDRELGERILRRILLLLINEAADALYLDIASREDLDLAMTKGVNYPKGLLAWADEIGREIVVTELDELERRYREDRYRASVGLRGAGRI